jgi:hypothetical protein
LIAAVLSLPCASGACSGTECGVSLHIQTAAESARRAVLHEKSAMELRYKEQITQLEAAMAKIQLEHERAKDHHEKTVDDHKRSHETAVSTLTNQMQTELHLQRTASSNHITQLTDSHGRTVEQIEAELARAKEAAQTAQDNARAAADGLESAVEERRRLADRNAEQGLQLTQMQAALEAEGRRRADVETERQQKDAECAQSRARIATMTSDKENESVERRAEREASRQEITAMRMRAEDNEAALGDTQRLLNSTRSQHVAARRTKREGLRRQAHRMARQVGQVREDCNILRTEVKMKREMMKNDVLRELGELQWYHKEDLGGVVATMQKQSRESKALYEQKMGNFREQLEMECAAHFPDQ